MNGYWKVIFTNYEVEIVVWVDEDGQSEEEAIQQAREIAASRGVNLNGFDFDEAYIC